MKSVLLVLALFSFSAHARGFETRLEEKMPVAQCTKAIQEFAAKEKLQLEAFGENDYYLMFDGEKVGNAYYSQGTCYIYLEN